MKLRSILLSGGVLGAACLTFAIQAHAGYKQGNAVFVDTAARFFSGALGAARNSADSTQYIACRTYGFSSGTTTTAYCFGRNSSGVSASCTTTNPVLVNLVMNFTADSHVAVYYDSAGMCTYVAVTTTSYNEPKVL